MLVMIYLVGPRPHNSKATAWMQSREGISELMFVIIMIINIVGPRPHNSKATLWMQSRIVKRAQIFQLTFVLIKKWRTPSSPPLRTLTHFCDNLFYATRLTYNCAHLRSTKESLTIWVKIFYVKFFLGWKIFGGEICLGKNFWGDNFLGEIFLGENCFWWKF